jgi:hypothetical protein
MDVLAGQETGPKAQHIQYAAKGKYDDDPILLIGDAPGDRDSADATSVRYYPINPGHEAESWERFHDEALARFLEGTYGHTHPWERWSTLRATPCDLSDHQIAWVEDTLAGMPDEEKVGQVFVNLFHFGADMFRATR